MFSSPLRCISRDFKGENRGNSRNGGDPMTQHSLTVHETMEIHEVLNFKTISMTKSKLMQGLVFDQELKALMAKDVDQSMKAMNALQGVLMKSQAKAQIQ
jgi:similar to spore coat protein